MFLVIYFCYYLFGSYSPDNLLDLHLPTLYTMKKFRLLLLVIYLFSVTTYLANIPRIIFWIYIVPLAFLNAYACMFVSCVNCVAEITTEPARLASLLYK